MYSKKKSLFGTFIFVLVIIACVALCYFSLAGATEPVAEDPVVEPAVEEAVVVEDNTGKELGAEPVGGPLVV